MKKLLLFIIAVLSIVACQKDFYLDDLNSAEQRIQQLESQKSNLNNEIAGLQNQLGSLQTNNENLVSQVSDLQSQLQTIQQQLDSSQILLSEANNTITELTGQIEEVMLLAAIELGVQNGDYVVTQIRHRALEETIHNVGDWTWRDHGSYYFGIRNERFIRWGYNSSYTLDEDTGETLEYVEEYKDLNQAFYSHRRNISLTVTGVNEVIVNFTEIFNRDNPDEFDVETEYRLLKLESDPWNNRTNESLNEIFRATGNGFFEDPIYGNIDPLNFDSIKEAFVLDAARNGLDVSYLRDESFEIEVVDFNYGAAYGSPCVSGSILIYYEDSYDPITPPYAMGVRFLRTMWHEFGHAALNLKHNRVDGDIMGVGDFDEGGPFAGEGPRITDTPQEDSYWDGLEGFKRASSRMFQEINQYSYECGFSTQKGHKIIP